MSISSLTLHATQVHVRSKELYKLRVWITKKRWGKCALLSFNSDLGLLTTVYREGCGLDSFVNVFNCYGNHKQTSGRSVTRTEVLSTVLHLTGYPPQFNVSGKCSPWGDWWDSRCLGCFQWFTAPLWYMCSTMWCVCNIIKQMHHTNDKVEHNNKQGMFVLGIQYSQK